ncbi:MULTISPECIES: Fe(3+) ABC transporter substrate-binding protein [Rhodobacterales]|jgi:iron(III) transport system substrate-binding protein|uniref:Fe(3+) ABC transporter substrate-binding protein n=1 Tax=Phaeobacter gallaeciensis TaxID=60890 RepID=A0A1B0ZRR2_9RHOB|nr:MULTISPECIES: Fe(3+) ABC transporter substrate-binding protein [Phaeobacter]MDF1773305.1 Fe(3+) ABC transporter substrate-binding protein [Pseudophaeobacter sp. bin_em_oilr2.035]MEE2635465.1 Fe(3+) ABC transporter substrate-binding protein [Pseudomonadota bacterium]ANP36872.1 iron deficiency-induced protein A [Phaeobacter gallaeciensis]MDE4061010.1 Fe(3+) ABC transporter substrate-binding protein [Phaeobacter gallaeciensis]MDE4097835.1 Fe(3+) ABC transporter substrate-binding protein [Phaeo
MLKATTILAGALAATIATSAAAEGEVNLYSSRHYDTDERLYSDFEEATGIRINRIEGKADELIARMQAEGENSPADILLTVDTSRLARAKDAGVLQSIDSDVLEARVPGYLQDADNQWFGFSQRARIIFYDKADVANPPQTYLDLADPAYKGLVCIRSSTNTYNQTLLASIITHQGSDVAKSWAEGVVANMARDPQGGDTDQLRGIVSGECEISVANSYYFARSIRKDVKGLSDSRDMIGWIFPAQNEQGAHMNLSGGGVAAHAPNRDNAIKFLEYLASDQAQQYFSAGNDEYPAVPGVGLAPSIAALGHFKPDDINLSDVAKNIPEAQKIFDAVGWK